MNVWVLRRWNQYDDIVSLHTNEDAARANLAGAVRSLYDKCRALPRDECDPDTMSDDEVIAMYFEDQPQGERGFTIYTEQVREETIDARVEFVRLGFHDASLKFRVSISDSATLREALLAAGEYNNFDPQAVADSFADLFLQTAGVEFGREDSPVLYVRTPAWRHQSVGTRSAPAVRIPQDERDALVTRIVAWAKTVKADEITVGEYNDVRVWWD